MLKRLAIDGVPEDGSCFNCGKITSGYNYCFGCKEYVCTDCGVNLNAGGHGHDPDEHLTEEEDDE